VLAGVRLIVVTTECSKTLRIAAIARGGQSGILPRGFVPELASAAFAVTVQRLRAKAILRDESSN
jgi:hypothetical protein